MKLKNKIRFCIIGIFLLLAGICNRNTYCDSKIKAETATITTELTALDEASSSEDTLTSLVNLFVRCERSIRNRTHKYERIKLVACCNIILFVKEGKWTNTAINHSLKQYTSYRGIYPHKICRKCKILRI